MRRHLQKVQRGLVHHTSVVRWWRKKLSAQQEGTTEVVSQKQLIVSHGQYLSRHERQKQSKGKRGTLDSSDCSVAFTRHCERVSAIQGETSTFRTSTRDCTGSACLLLYSSSFSRSRSLSLSFFLLISALSDVASSLCCLLSRCALLCSSQLARKEEANPTSTCSLVCELDSWKFACELCEPPL